MFSHAASQLLEDEVDAHQVGAGQWHLGETLVTIAAVLVAGNLIQGGSEDGAGNV